MKITTAAVLTVLFILLGSCGAADDTPEASGTAEAPISPSEAPAQAAASPEPIMTPVPTTTPQPAPTYEFIGKAVSTASDYVNIRHEADINSRIKGSFPAGASAGVIEYSGQWARILYGNIEGYVSRDYILEVKYIKTDVPEGGWASVVVNPSNTLPEGFEVELADFEGGKVDARILDVCRQMFADAKEDGISLKLVDAYRSRETQSEEYEKR